MSRDCCCCSLHLYNMHASSILLSFHFQFLSHLVSFKKLCYFYYQWHPFNQPNEFPPYIPIYLTNDLFQLLVSFLFLHFIFTYSAKERNGKSVELSIQKNNTQNRVKLMLGFGDISLRYFLFGCDNCLRASLLLLSSYNKIVSLGKCQSCNKGNNILVEKQWENEWLVCVCNEMFRFLSWRNPDKRLAIQGNIKYHGSVEKRRQLWHPTEETWHLFQYSI